MSSYVPFIPAYVTKKLNDQSLKNKEIKLYCRSCVIIPSMIGRTFAVYNGKKFINVYVSERMVGHRLGEFSFTRKIGKIHSAQKK